MRFWLNLMRLGPINDGEKNRASWEGCAGGNIYRARPNFQKSWKIDSINQNLHADNTRI